MRKPSETAILFPPTQQPQRTNLMNAVPKHNVASDAIIGLGIQRYK